MPEIKAGLEIHQQLDTRYKLFCRCQTKLRDVRESSFEFQRVLRPTASEMGEVDVAAMEEFRRGRRFIYKAYDTTCLVENDEEPPRELNKEALDLAIEVALLLNMKVVDEVHTMRKIVIDGSNTCGFQRTAFVASDGFIETESGRVSITILCLEEDAAQIVSTGKDTATYSLDRLGIPLVEIATGADIKSPAHAREVAEHLGMVLRSTGKVKRGLGTIRQDINVSIKGGARIEIKGVQELDLIEKLIAKEVERQQNLIKAGKQVQEETRKALEDGSTEYMRPLPGAARMYPETDVPPVRILKERIERIKSSLPELFTQRKRRYMEKSGLNEEMAAMIAKGDFVLFESVLKEMPSTSPTLVANTLTSFFSELTREMAAQQKIPKISGEFVRDVFRLVAEGKIAKEGIYPVLREHVLNPSKSAEEAAKKLGLISDVDVEKIIDRIVSGKKDFIKERGDSAFQPLMGLVMKELRGKVDGALISKMLRERLDKEISSQQSKK